MGLGHGIRRIALEQGHVETGGDETRAHGTQVVEVFAKKAVFVLDLHHQDRTTPAHLLRPEGAAAYATAEGMIVICVGAAVSAIAFRIMIRIGRLPESRRWFG
jgi:hypothetical protein